MIFSFSETTAPISTRTKSKADINKITAIAAQNEKNGNTTRSGNSNDNEKNNTKKIDYKSKNKNKNNTRNKNKEFDAGDILQNISIKQLYQH